ncbi:MAG: ATPase [Flavobacteriales bacterium]|jgi:nicotinamide riboside kinase|nr:ATPase [Flavobacteriales bacterium]|tara:strand:- start:332 stop:829 length:498 start_codon:yes stop_codon:yes gene_type:complete
MKKIVFTGPESSGKTTISQAVAKKYNLPIVEEYARKYLTKLNRQYKYEDLIEIAKGQLKSEEKKSDNEIIICDTNLQVLKIWSQIKYHQCDSFILDNQDPNCFYILCSPDFKWEYDPLRENENNRYELFKKYHEDLLKNKYDFKIIKGSHEKRMKSVSDLIKKII